MIARCEKESIEAFEPRLTVIERMQREDAELIRFRTLFESVGTALIAGRREAAQLYLAMSPAPQPIENDPAFNNAIAYLSGHFHRWAQAEISKLESQPA